MKSILLITCFFFISVSLFAQTVADAGTVSDTKIQPTEKINITTAMAEAHNTLAFTQIGDYLKEHLVYPAEMTEYALAGTVTAIVIFNDQGEIAKTMIAKTELPKAFEQEVTKSLMAFKQLDLKSAPAFYGKRLIYVPVNFSL
ncbi:MAG: hypothetical protein AAF840_06730 [Bacteroidota bacterium]